MGCPSVDPELMIRLLLVGYCYGIRSQRRLCEGIHFNLAYRRFCRLRLDDKVPPTIQRSQRIAMDTDILPEAPTLVSAELPVCLVVPVRHSPDGDGQGARHRVSGHCHALGEECGVHAPHYQRRRGDPHPAFW